MKRAAVVFSVCLLACLAALLASGVVLDLFSSSGGVASEDGQLLTEIVRDKAISAPRSESGFFEVQTVSGLDSSASDFALDDGTTDIDSENISTDDAGGFPASSEMAPQSADADSGLSSVAPDTTIPGN